MDIKSGNKYPSGALSNFAPHPFVLDGNEVNSMEGFLQGLKFKSRERIASRGQWQQKEMDQRGRQP